MADESTPTTTLSLKIKTMIESIMTGLSIKVYDYFPPEGVSPNCVVMQPITGKVKAPMGQRVSATQVGAEVIETYQIDVYANSDAMRKTMSDRLIHVGYLTWRPILKRDGVDMSPANAVRDMPDPTPGARIFRKVMEITFKIVATKSDSA